MEVIFMKRLKTLLLTTLLALSIVPCYAVPKTDIIKADPSEKKEEATQETPLPTDPLNVQFDEQYKDQFALVHFFIADTEYVSDEKNVSFEVLNTLTDTSYEINFPASANICYFYLPEGEYKFVQILTSNDIITNENFILDENYFSLEVNETYDTFITGTYSDPTLVTEGEYRQMEENGEDTSQVTTKEKKENVNLKMATVRGKHMINFIADEISELWVEFAIFFALIFVVVISKFKKKKEEDKKEDL